MLTQRHKLELERTVQMSDNEMRIAICEACGWAKVRKIWDGSEEYPGEEWVWRNPDFSLRGQICIPDYLLWLWTIHQAQNPNQFFKLVVEKLCRLMRLVHHLQRHSPRGLLTTIGQCDGQVH